MKTLPLPSLRADKPIAFLAAVGLLRVLESVRPGWQPRLRWLNEGHWIAAISCATEDVSIADVTEAVEERLRGRAGAFEFNWADVIAVKPEKYRESVKKVLATTRFDERQTADFFAAFGAENAVSNSGDVKPTPLCMTSGQMKFLQEIRVICKSLAAPPPKTLFTKDGENLFRQALQETWQYDDDQHSLGWDPGNEPVHALGAYDPSGQGKQTSVRAIVYLAIESLAAFPVFARGNRLQATGFRRDEHRRTYFYWPVWEAPLTWKSICSLLQLQEIFDRAANDMALTARGVRVIYRSRRHEFGKGYGIFRPAELCLSPREAFQKLQLEANLPAAKAETWIRESEGRREADAAVWISQAESAR